MKINSKIFPCLLGIIIFLMPYFLSGQTFEEFKKLRQAELQEMKKQQQEFLEKMQKEFDQYVEQRDKEFAEYLKKEWEQFNLFKAREPVKRPKPDIMPEYDPEKRKEETWEKIPVLPPALEIRHDEIILPRVHKTEAALFDKSIVKTDFYSNILDFEIDKGIYTSPPLNINEETISSFWEALSQTNYNHLLNQLLEEKQLMQLNDWGYYLLIQHIANDIYPDNKNGAEMLVWILLNRSGYRAKIAYADNQVSLLIPSVQTIYFKKYLNIKGTTYYLMKDLGESTIYTYTQDFPDAGRIMDFNIYHPLNLGDSFKEKLFNFTYAGNTYPIKISYNETLMRFYKNYPVVDLDVYFNAVVSAGTKESILESFLPVINEMEETTAVSFLLNFVQNAFAYKIDEEQFGKEKFFFPAEVFYYPYSDCEDRSVLFSYLINELFDMKIIGLAFTGHVATAVHFDEEVEGDHVVYKNEKYIIADPTYINAPIGLTMPEYKGAEAEVVELLNNNNTWLQISDFWDLAMASSGYRGSNLNDAALDEEGNGYLSGYFTGEIKLGAFDFKSGKNRKMFIVKYNSDGNVVWANAEDGSGQSTGLALAMDDNGFIYVAGSYNGSIHFSDIDKTLECEEGASDIFIAKYNPRGRLIWAEKAGLDCYEQNIYLTYMALFDADGKLKDSRLYNENECYDFYGLFIDDKGDVYFTGAFNNTTGMNYAEMAYNDGRKHNPIESLKAENDVLISQDYDKAIAGLFAVANLMKYSGYKISGRDAQMALDKYNPSFKNKYPVAYKGIGRINFILSDFGIVNITTSDGRTVFIDKIKIADNSAFKFTYLESGDAKIDILNGIKVGKLMIWFKLNFVKMFKKNGDMLFDWDTDHTQKTMNLKGDILK